MWLQVNNSTFHRTDLNQKLSSRERKKNRILLNKYTILRLTLYSRCTQRRPLEGRGGGHDRRLIPRTESTIRTCNLINNIYYYYTYYIVCVCVCVCVSVCVCGCVCVCAWNTKIYSSLLIVYIGYKKARINIKPRFKLPFLEFSNLIRDVFFYFGQRRDTAKIGTRSCFTLWHFNVFVFIPRAQDTHFFYNTVCLQYYNTSLHENFRPRNLFAPFGRRRKEPMADATGGSRSYYAVVIIIGFFFFISSLATAYNSTR